MRPMRRAIGGSEDSGAAAALSVGDALGLAEAEAGDPPAVGYEEETTGDGYTAVASGSCAAVLPMIDWRCT